MMGNNGHSLSKFEPGSDMSSIEAGSAGRIREGEKREEQDPESPSRHLLGPQVYVAHKFDQHTLQTQSSLRPPAREDVLPCWGFSVGQNRGLPACTAPSWTVRPYINWGYRDQMKVRQSFNSLFYCHNETGNVMTHLGGFFVFLGLFIRDLFFRELPLHHRAVACCYLLVAMFCMGSSTVFHLLSPISKKGYELALRCDMTGIALVIMASFMIGIHYGYWCHSDLGHMYLGIVSMLSCIALAWPYIPALFRNFNASVSFFASFVAFALVPLFHWCYLVGGPNSVQANLFLYKLLSTFASYALGFIFYATQFPEKRWPGRFDLFGHSHQIWHVFVFVGAFLFYVAVATYADFRVQQSSCEGL